MRSKSEVLGSAHLLMAWTELSELSKSKQVPLRTGAGLDVRGRPDRNTIDAAESRDRRNWALSIAEGIFTPFGIC